MIAIYKKISSRLAARGEGPGDIVRRLSVAAALLLTYGFLGYVVHDSMSRDRIANHCETATKFARQNSDQSLVPSDVIEKCTPILKARNKEEQAVVESVSYINKHLDR